MILVQPKKQSKIIPANKKRLIMLKTLKILKIIKIIVIPKIPKILKIIVKSLKIPKEVVLFSHQVTPIFLNLISFEEVQEFISQSNFQVTKATIQELKQENMNTLIMMKRKVNLKMNMNMSITMKKRRKKI